MLVIISDLHLTDGTRDSTISSGAFDLLAELVCDLVVSASHRRDGSYQPIDRVDLVLLGDVLDVIRSTQWLQSPLRPWDNNKSVWIVQWIAELRGATSSSFYQHALTEQDFRNRRAKHRVYGHTHHAETVPLDASYADGYVLHQTYFNSGTWRRVHEQTQFAPREHEFIAADTMTYLDFFKDDQRGGRPYETWTGALGVQPHISQTHRFDTSSQAGATSHGHNQPLSTPNVPVRAPHFAVPIAPNGIANRSTSD